MTGSQSLHRLAIAQVTYRYLIAGLLDAMVTLGLGAVTMGFLSFGILRPTSKSVLDVMIKGLGGPFYDATASCLTVYAAHSSIELSVARGPGKHAYEVHRKTRSDR